MRNSGSLRTTETNAPNSENDDAYHGPGNFDSGWNFCMYRMRESKAVTTIASTEALTLRKLNGASIVSASVRTNSSRPRNLRRVRNLPSFYHRGRCRTHTQASGGNFPIRERGARGLHVARRKRLGPPGSELCSLSVCVVVQMGASGERRVVGWCKPG
jgi:hypothetical protein